MNLICRIILAVSFARIPVHIPAGVNSPHHASCLTFKAQTAEIATVNASCTLPAILLAQVPRALPPESHSALLLSW